MSVQNVEASIPGSCVLYVMDRDKRVQDNNALIAAQTHALSKKLPLAVVYCLQSKTDAILPEEYSIMLDNFKRTEADLKKLQIAFIVVIGNPTDKLAAVRHHTKPDAVYFESDQITSKSLVKHSYKWPGTVQSIATLQKYITESTITS